LDRVIFKTMARSGKRCSDSGGWVFEALAYFSSFGYFGGGVEPVIATRVATNGTRIEPL
jgi:hypothetical protein